MQNIYGEFNFSPEDDIEPFHVFTDSHIDIAEIESGTLNSFGIDCAEKRL